MRRPSLDIYARRLGPGIEGLARGLGLLLVVATDLPPGIRAASGGGVILLRDTGHEPTNLRAACAEIARASCAPADAPRVAEELYEFLRRGIDN
jgi:hypothetical protein